MRMILTAQVPHEKFNAAVADGTAGSKLKQIIEEAKPEAVYFTEQDGMRCAIMIINVDNPSQIPSYSEPWFLAFEADCQFRICMTPQDLERADLESLGKKWATTPVTV